MKTRVVTLMWGTAWERYGERFYTTYDRYWSSPLTIVTDRELPVLDDCDLILFDEIPEIGWFRDKWRREKQANGLVVPPGYKRNAKGYSFKFDAVKWMPQAMAPIAAVGGMQYGDILVWLDADVETKAEVPESWPEELLDGHDVAGLFRGNYHPEIGFYAMRISPATCRVLRRFANFYSSGTVFGLSEWHSAYVWHEALKSEPELKIRNLSPGTTGGHVWPNTELAKYTEHHKGKRKPQ